MTSLNKYIAQSGLCSRRQADALIYRGLVKINGKVARPIDKVTTFDKVFVKDKLITPQNEKIYLAFNKPYGVISTTDKNSKNTIMDYIDISQRVFPIGRLDVKSEGLILLTNDGEVAQKILKNKEVEKEYLVRVNKFLSDNFLNHLQNGVMLEGRMTLPARIKKISSKEFRITLLEGRKRQIRRMCEHFHFEVISLKRIRIGKIELEKIAPGKFIVLEPKKIYNLLGLI